MNKLKQLLSDHPECLSSRNVFRSFLTDIVLDDKRTVNILSCIYESGILHKIHESRRLTDNDIQNYINLLYREYGIEPRFACECILTLLDAYDIPTHSFKKTFESNGMLDKRNLSIASKEFETDMDTNSTFETGDTCSSDSDEFELRLLEARRLFGSFNDTITINSQNGPELRINGVIKDYEIKEEGDGYCISSFDRFTNLEINVFGSVDGKQISGVSEDAFKKCLLQKRKTKVEHILPNQLPKKALEAIDALEILGFDHADVVDTISSIPESELISMSMEKIVRECLKKLNNF